MQRWCSGVGANLRYNRLAEGNVDDRMTNLEVKIAFVERHVAQLDDLVRQMVDGLAELRAELDRVREMQDAPATSVRGTLEEEVPPHHVRW